MAGRTPPPRHAVPPLSYAVGLSAVALVVLLVTITATGSVWWALLALLATGPVARVVLDAVGVGGARTGGRGTPGNPRDPGRRG